MMSTFSGYNMLSHKLYLNILIGFLAFFNTSHISFAQKNYNGAQLLRIENLRNETVQTILFEDYGGVDWKHSEHAIDISFEQQNLEKVKNFISKNGGTFKILIPNIQDLMENNEFNRTKRSTGMNWTGYSSHSVINEYLLSLPNLYPNIANVFKIGTTLENRNILLLRISNNVAVNKAIFIDGGIHAREWISPASVTYIINHLLSHWNTKSTKLTNKTWYFVPIVNPDGYEYSRNSDRLWRKNRKTFTGTTCVGVDLNRNFDIDWNSASQSSNKCSETYKGLNAFSEIESNAIKTFLTNNKSLLQAYLTLHSYGQYILWPYGYTSSGIAANASNMKTAALTAVSNIKALTGFSYTASRSILLGLIAGASDDWAKVKLGIAYTYTVELRDTGNYGFLLPASQIISTGQEALEVATVVAQSF